MGKLLISTLRLVALGAILAGCGSAFGLAGDESPLTGRSANQQAIAYRAAWHIDLDPGGVNREETEQLAAAAYDPAGNRVFVGSAGGDAFHAFRASDGARLWSAPLKGGTSGHAVLDGNLVIVGTDAGRVVSFDALAKGEQRWTYTVQGAVNQPPVLAGAMVYVVDGTNAIYALDRRTGEWRWQYRREAPGRFALFGEAVPTVADGRVFVGFSDGLLVALGATDGAVLWTRDLAPEAEQFEDVDASAVVIGDTVYAASVAGGLYALGATDGRVRWAKPVKGITVLTELGGELIAGFDDGRIARLAPNTARPRWQVKLGDHEGAPRALVQAGDQIAVTAAQGALRLLDARTGRPIWRFDPGSGFLASPTVGADGSLFVLSNGGRFYAFRPARGVPRLPALNPLSTSSGRGFAPTR